jgi:hypothetical protein
MITKKLVLAAALLAGTASAALAQGYGYYGAPYRDGFYGPRYGYSSGVYGRAPYYGYYRDRGGPGPRTLNGTGEGIGAER